jgi:uncharacterized repeat protein (TIGR01451 family)
VTVSLLIAFGLALQAQNKPELKAFRVLTQNGKETFQPGTKLVPGEVIEYRLSYKNTTTAAQQQVNLIIPVPSQLVFEPNANLKTPTAASTDGAKYGPLPLKRKVERAGTTIEETVPLSEYRFLRWTIPTVTPGESVEVKARMRLPK